MGETASGAPAPRNDEVLAQLASGSIPMTGQLSVCEQLGFKTSPQDHGQLGGLLAGKIGTNKFVAQYAIDSRAKCRHVKCNNYILVNDLRIGKIPPSIKTRHSCRTHWYHVPCIFQSFNLVCKGTKIITDVSDIAGFDLIKPADRAMVQAYIDRGRNQPLLKDQNKRKKRRLDDSPQDENRTAHMRPAELDCVHGLTILGAAPAPPEPAAPVGDKQPDDSCTEPRLPLPHPLPDFA